MARRDSSPEALEAFGLVCDELKARAEVSEGRWFGVPAATVSGRVFAALYEDALVVKLGAEEVDRHVAAAQGERFDPSGKGRAMKEWLLAASGPAAWPELTELAVAFVGGDDDADDR
jgi:hypothetical protein